MTDQSAVFAYMLSGHLFGAVLRISFVHRHPIQRNGIESLKRHTSELSSSVSLVVLLKLTNEDYESEGEIIYCL